VNFTGTGEVLISEYNVNLEAGLGFFSGCFGICCSLLVLGLGVIFAFKLKDPAAAGVLYQPGATGGAQVVGMHASPDMSSGQGPIMHADGSVTEAAPMAAPTAGSEPAAAAPQVSSKFSQTYEPYQPPE